MCGGGGYRPPPAPAPVVAAPIIQPAKQAKGRRRTQASATFSSPRQAAAEKAGALNSGTLLSQANPGVGNTLLGA
tara:strand:- start:461 stop:685 length:225 start_codon:yes stop_codon:yes gene_type:complete